ncbi:VPLPA-CTERM sorting domain-containing protein [Phaeovibrio sulfidiphilus]|uniref:VPLPA-CTERM sorting domain-containing protein n=1 Tax=Phaeovibrio sulfidiphilus TaxID=1220600 RepID=A0A8J6YY94_9PROT|nr:VPLPA-CTERM sorting domain-containing protein [Phaeovibrio sulfidiphilus]MBE1236743.1 VPLPA-CTERM sorting domain-containing protein [Phaeovibrio sulfidiphilus]
MTAQVKTGAMRAMVLGAAAFLASAVVAPPPVAAAPANDGITDMHFKLGTISQPQKTPSGQWVPATGGSFEAYYYTGSKGGGGGGHGKGPGYGGGNGAGNGKGNAYGGGKGGGNGNGPGFGGGNGAGNGNGNGNGHGQGGGGKGKMNVFAEGSASGALGVTTVPTMRDSMKGDRSPRAFTNTYDFSLHKDSSLNLALNLTGKDGTQTSFAGESLTVRLTGKNGFSFTETFGGVNWSHIWGNLKAGDYTLSISGQYGLDAKCTRDGFLQGYQGSFSVGDATPGDVPLPGALILLGSALAGAGAWGRRKKARTTNA